MNLALNILWFVLGGFWSGLSWLIGGALLAITIVGLPWTAAGWWIALGHLIIAVAQAVTIIGLPFAVQHVKLAGLALAPVGKTITPPL